MRKFTLTFTQAHTRARLCDTLSPLTLTEKKYEAITSFFLYKFYFPVNFISITLCSLCSNCSTLGLVLWFSSLCLLTVWHLYSPNVACHTTKTYGSFLLLLLLLLPLYLCISIAQIFFYFQVVVTVLCYCFARIDVYKMKSYNNNSNNNCSFEHCWLYYIGLHEMGNRWSRSSEAYFYFFVFLFLFFSSNCCHYHLLLMAMMMMMIMCEFVCVFHFLILLLSLPHLQKNYSV